MSAIAAVPPVDGAYKEAEDVKKPSIYEVALEKDLKAARERICELESQVARLEKELSNNNKRKATDNVPASSKKLKTVTPAATSLNTKKLISKRLAQTIKNSLKGIKFFNGYDATDRHVNVNDMLSMEEFEALFGDYGTLIQPTPSNKPTSTVYIKQLSADDMKGILNVDSFKAELWSKGGRPTYGGGWGFGGFGGGGGFSKGQKIKGGCQVVLRSAQAKYSSNNGKLLLKCTFSNKRMFDEIDSDDDGYDY